MPANQTPCAKQQPFSLQKTIRPPASLCPLSTQIPQSGQLPSQRPRPPLPLRPEQVPPLPEHFLHKSLTPHRQPTANPPLNARIVSIKSTSAVSSRDCSGLTHQNPSICFKARDNGISRRFKEALRFPLKEICWPPLAESPRWAKPICGVNKSYYT